MFRKRPIDISTFFIAGINYKKTDACIRGQYAINIDNYEQMLANAPSFGINEVFVLSTCNRTEIYGFAENAQQLASLLCSQTMGSLEKFNDISYSKSGRDAILHLFNVSAGLDSQILGDYEIVGQIKKSAKFSKQRNFMGAYLERMVNAVLQASKNIRTNTHLSGGTVSVSFAAVQYIKAKYKDLAAKKILLIGTGKIGTNTCKNLSDYLPGARVTLVNRSAERAIELAASFNFEFDHIENLQQCINEAEIIIVATNANEPIVFCEHLSGTGEKLIIDLSVPCNVDRNVKDMGNITLVNVDELSKIKDETLIKRSAEIPAVKAIIDLHIQEFMEWHEMRKHVPILADVKNKLLTLQAERISDPLLFWPVCKDDHQSTEILIQKVINGMAVKMRTQNQRGCNYIEAINDFISIPPGAIK